MRARDDVFVDDRHHDGRSTVGENRVRFRQAGRGDEVDDKGEGKQEPSAHELGPASGLHAR